MRISARGVALEVEDHGPANGEPLVLIMGLAMQLVAWHEDFVAMLVARGFRVIRFDNRDCGLSQSFDELGVPNLAMAGIRFSLGLKVTSPYGIGDLAGDTVGLLDALGLRSAHVCGASMGGMVAQHLAAHHADRVRSATLMMTTSGSRRLPQPSFAVRAAMMSRPARPIGEDSIVDHLMRLHRLIGSPAYPPDEAWLRERVRMSTRRAYRPRGTVRQVTAIIADGDRSPMLANIRVPTQIVHGQADPLVPVGAAHDLAAKIAGARLDLIDGMGHDFPPALWPRFVDAIAGAAGRA